MNKKRRASLDEAIKKLYSAREIVSDVRDCEQDSLNNIPESFEGTNRYDAMEQAVSCLESALEEISDAIGHIREAKEQC